MGGSSSSASWQQASCRVSWGWWSVAPQWKGSAAHSPAASKQARFTRPCGAWKRSALRVTWSPGRMWVMSKRIGRRWAWSKPARQMSRSSSRWMRVPWERETWVRSVSWPRSNLSPVPGADSMWKWAETALTGGLVLRTSQPLQQGLIDFGLELGTLNVAGANRQGGLVLDRLDQGVHVGLWPWP